MLAKVAPATQGVQEVALPPAFELPAGQSVQARSAVAEPGCAAEATEPAAHVVQGWHAVAPGAAEKLAAGQAAQAAAPSAPYVPAGHALHTTSPVGEPGVEGHEPAGHLEKGTQAPAPALAA